MSYVCMYADDDVAVFAACAMLGAAHVDVHYERCFMLILVLVGGHVIMHVVCSYACAIWCSPGGF